MSDEINEPDVWSVYLLDCDGRLYAGIALDTGKRLAQHRSGSRGAKFTRGALRIELVYAVAVGDRSRALKIEARLKKLPRTAKLGIVAAQPDAAALCARLGIDTSCETV